MLNHQSVVANRTRATEKHLVQGHEIEPPSIANVLPSVLQALVEANLSAGGYRVVLDTLARLLLRGVASEAVPVEWMADRLGLSRNTVSAGYQAAVEAGLLRRQAVAERGAPTRTVLQGPMLRLLTTMPEGPRDVHGATRRFNRTRGLRTSSRRRKTAWMASQPSVNKAAVTKSHVDSDQKNGIGHAECTKIEKDENTQPTVKTFFPSEAGSVLAKLTPKEMMDTLKTIPHDARVMATLARSPQDFNVDPSWNLSEMQITALRMLVPRPEPVRSRSSTTPSKLKDGQVAHRDLVLAMRNWMPRLERLVGKGRAPVVADEIAYQVMEKLLGNGNHAGGVRAGLSLVAKGVWRTPRGFTADWNGAIDRGWKLISEHHDVAAKSTLRETVDDQKTVH